MEQSLIEAYQLHNPWWERLDIEKIGKSLTPQVRQTPLGQVSNLEKFSRSDFEVCLNTVRSNRLTLIGAPNGIGKTTTLAKIATTLSKMDEVPEQNLFYFPLRQPVLRQGDGESITRAVEWYSRNVYGTYQQKLDDFSQDAEKTTEEAYLLIDDVHMASDWASQIRKVLESYPDVKVIATSPTLERGNLSKLDFPSGKHILLHQKFFDYVDSQRDQDTSESVKSRCYSVRDEVQDFAINPDESDLLDSLDDLYQIVSSADIDLSKAARRYLRHGNVKTRPSSDVMRDLELTMYRDIPQFQPVESPGDLHVLCSIAAIHTESARTLKDWSSDIGVDRRTFSRYIEILNDFYIMTPSDHYGHERRRSVKLYIRDPAHILSLAETGARGPVIPSNLINRLYTSVTFDHCKRLGYYYHRKDTSVDYWDGRSGNVDFILPAKGADIPIALAIDRPVEDAADSISGFLKNEELDSDGGIVLTNEEWSSDTQILERHADIRIACLPIDLFLFSI